VIWCVLISHAGFDQVAHQALRSEVRAIEPFSLVGVCG